MKKTFDQICADILGENMMAPTKPAQQPNQQPQQGQPQQGQPQQQQQTEEVPEEIANLFIAAKTPQEVNAAYMKLQQMKQQTPNIQTNQQQQNAANKPA
jgi:hypothetical protein